MVQPGNAGEFTPCGVKFDPWKTGSGRVNILSFLPSTDSSKAVLPSSLFGDNLCDRASARNK